MNTKPFSLRAILSVTTERLLTKPKGERDNGIGDLYEILNHITGDNLFTHVLPRAGRFAKPLIYGQHPELGVAEACLPSLDKWLTKFKSAPERSDRVKGDGSDAVTMWLAELKMLFPNLKDEYEIESHADAWLSMNSMEELENLVGPEKVVTVALP